MKDTWSSVPLSHLLAKSEDWVDLEADTAYQEVTVRLWGKGVVERRRVLGAEIGAGRRFIVRSGQFILSRIDARNGALGIVPDELDGAVVSNDFPAFTINSMVVLPSFLAWLSRTHGFVDLCRAASEGTTNRVRLQEGRFLATRIPLPPLDEQRRIVARIEELAGKIEEARGLRRDTIKGADELMTAAEMEVWPDTSLAGAPTLGDVTTYLARGRQSEQGESTHYLIKTQHVQLGRYVRTDLTLAPHVAAKVGAEALAQQGDTLIACSAAGCLGRVAYYDDAERVASTDTHVAVARPRTEIVLPEYLYAYLRGAQGQLQLRSREKGDWQREKVGFRLTELNVADMRKVPVPLPTLERQQQIVQYLGALQSQLDMVRRTQAETAVELDALLPSILDRAFKGELV